MDRSKRFSWLTPWKIIVGAIVLLAVTGIPAGLYFWKSLAVKDLLDAVELNDDPAMEKALKTVKERNATDLALSRLLNLLETGSKDTDNVAFYRALSGIGPPAVSALQDMVENHTDTNVRISAIGSLGGMVIFGGSGDDVKKSVPTLLRALKDEDKNVRFQAALAISYVDQTKAEQTLPTLFAFLKDDNRDIRFNAAYGIGKFGKHAEDALPEFLKALSDPDFVVRAMVVSALGDIGIPDKTVIEALVIEMADEKSRHYRNRVARSLGKLGPPAKSAVPALLEALKDWQDVKEDGIDRSAAIEALGEIGHDSPEVIQALIDALNDTRFALCREDAAIALGKFGPKAIQAVPDLIKASRDYDDGVEHVDLYPDLREEAIKALEKIDPAIAQRIRNESAGEEQYLKER